MLKGPPIRERCADYFAARPGRKRHSSRNELRSTSGHPLAIFPAYIRSDWSTRDIVGTSKKFEPRVQPLAAVNRAHNYITAALERARVEYLRRTNPIDAGGFVDVARNANVGLHFFDELARGGAADRLAAHDSIAFGVERRWMTDHQERPHVAHEVVAGAQRRVDFVLGELGGRTERRDVRPAASEDADSARHPTLAMQRDSIGFEKRNDFALVEIAGEREHGRT